VQKNEKKTSNFGKKGHKNLAWIFEIDQKIRLKFLEEQDIWQTHLYATFGQ